MPEASFKGYATFEEWRVAVDRQTADLWKENGGALAFNPVTGDMDVGHVLRDDEEESWEVREAALRTFQRLMDFIWAEGPCIMKAMARLATITHCGSPHHLLAMNESELALLMNEPRGTTNARRMRVWEEFLESKGFFGTRRPNQKSDEGREAYKKRAAGNVNRLGGKKAARKFSALRKRQGPEGPQ